MSKPTINDIVKLCGNTHISVKANIRIGHDWFEDIEIASIQCGIDVVPRTLSDCTVVALKNTIKDGLLVINSIDIVVQGRLELFTSQIKGDCDEKGTKV